MRTPWKLLIIMKLTTPATASAPYAGRGAAGDDVNALDQSRRNGVQVGDRGLRVTGLQAAAIDQHDGPARAEVPQVDGGGAVTIDGLAEVLTTEDLRQRVGQGVDGGRTGDLHVFLADGHAEGCWRSGSVARYANR